LSVSHGVYLWLIYVLSNAQAEVVFASEDKVSVRDEKGKLLGYFSPVSRDPHFSDADIEAAKAALRAPGPRYLLSDIIAHLNSFEAR